MGEPIPIQHYLPSPGGSDESVFLFCGRVDATAASGVHGLAEEHEDIRVVVKTLAEIETLLDQGAIESGHILIGLYWLLRHRDHLRRLWAGPPAPHPSPLPASGEREGPALAGGEGQPPINAGRTA